MRNRVLVADDHPSIHTAVRKILEPKFEIVACVSNGAALLRLATVHQPDVLVLDISIAGGGIQVIRALHATPSPPCWQTVILTTHSDPGILREARRAGALGYVLKCRAVEQLPLAVTAVLAGREFVSPSVLESA